MKRPNVLLLYTDQQRWDALHCVGNPLIHTPNLDALAARGTLFRKVFANCPVCMPSRMSMLSGRYPGALGIRCNGIEMPEHVECVQHVLQRYGYHTANLGKLHFHNHTGFARDHREPHPRYGFTTLILSDEPGCYDDAYIKWVTEKDPEAVDHCRCDTPPAWTGTPVQMNPRDTNQPYPFPGPEDLTHTAFVAEETCDFIRQHAHEPFFCIAGFYAPHCPINPPQRFIDMYAAHDMPLPRLGPDSKNYGNTSDEQWRKTVACYYALITHVDDQIGRTLATLRECGIEDDTMVIFTADHGENLGDHGLVGKGNAHDSSARVPLIVAAPGCPPAPAPVDNIIEAVDLAPTLLDICGVQTPPAMQGRSFRPVLQGHSQEARGSAFIEYALPGANGYKAVRTHKWLYVRNQDGTEQVYDLETDPHQIAPLPEAQATPHLPALRSLLLDRWFDTQPSYPKQTAHY